MKKFYVILILFMCFSDIEAQRFFVDEENTLSICDVDVTAGGVPADNISICQNSVNGTSTVAGNCINYQPDNNFFGYDSICITTCIGGVCTDSVVQITINPVGEDFSFSLNEDASYFACEAALTGGANATFAVCGGPSFGTANTNPACITYFPSTNFVGNDTVCATICVDTLCETSNIIFSVTPVTETISVTDAGNGAVVCYPDLQTVVDNVANINITTSPSNGTATLNQNTQCITYSAGAAITSSGTGGTDAFSVTVCNDEGVCDVTNVNVTILGFTVTNSTNATDLAQSLAGNGVTISNAILNCATAGSGTFINAPAALGISEGVVLSSGAVSDIQGSPLSFPSTNFVSGGDPDLDNLLNSLGETYNSFDACVLEFDIEVLGDSLTFNYAMGSEEYPEPDLFGTDNYVCGSVNDIFGFFITGPNPAGPNYASQNVALIPGTTTPVSINTVNNGVSSGGAANTCELNNTAFFNDSITQISYDGVTQTLQAKALTVPCETYRFKLAIADGGDGLWDSGVFLEAGSFQSIPVSLASQTNLGNAFTNAVEGCVNGEFVFQLDEPLPNDYTIRFGLGGTATNGVDYTSVPDSIIIPAGDTTFTLNIATIDDGIVEPTEVIKLFLLNNCTNQPYDSAEIDLIDAIPFSISTNASVICPGDSALLSAVVSGANSGAATYQWVQDGTVLNEDSGFTYVTPSSSTLYFVDYTLGNCTQRDSIQVDVNQFSTNLDSSSISCPGANDGSLWLTPSNPIGAVTYNWVPVGSSDSLISGLGPDTYTYTLTDQSGLACGIITDSVTLTEPSGLSVSYDSTNITCKDANDGSITIKSLQANATYEIAIFLDGVNLIPLQGFTANASGEILFDLLSPGNYDSVYVFYPLSGCDNSFQVNLTEPDSLLTSINLSDSISCYGQTADSLTTNTSGGTLPYSYNWSTSEITQSIVNVTAGNYWVEITDANNCTISDTLEVTEPDSVYVALASDSASCFGSTDGLAYVDSISGGFLPYSYTWDASANNQITDTAFNLSQGSYTLTVNDNNNCSFQESITVEEPLEIIVSETHTDVLCFGDTNASIDITITNGQAPLSYSWSGSNSFSAITEDITNLGAGSYSFTVTDNNNCFDTISVSINEPTALSLSISSTNITCKDLDNGTATVSVSGGTPNYTYAWDGGANPSTDAVSNLAPGTYQVIVTDANNCEDSISTIAITEPDSLLLSIDNIIDASCNGSNDGAINVSTSGGTPVYTYSWTNGGGSNEDLSNANAGSYSLTVTDGNNCSASITETITEPSAIQINLSKTDVDCFGATTGTINAAVSGGTIASAYSFSWVGPNNFTASTQNVTSLAAGTYTLTVTDDNNCTNSASITITEPQEVIINFVMSPVNCFGGNDGSLTANVSSGGSAPFNYTWDANANNQNTATATNLSEGSYTITVTDANNCSYSASEDVTQPNTPLSLEIDSTDISCAGYNDGTASVTASGGTPGYTYNWSTTGNASTPSVENLAPGSVSVTVTDANNCTEIASTTINEPTPLVVIAEADSVNCWGDENGTISLTASGGTGLGYLYSIDGGNTFQNDSIFTGLAAGIYSEIVIQDLGAAVECISQAIQTIVEQPAFFDFSINPEDTTLQLSEPVTLNFDVNSPYTIDDIVSVSWTPTVGLSCSDCIAPELLTYERYSDYIATVSYQGNDNVLCLQSATATIQVENNLNLFIPNAFTPSSFDNVNNTFLVYGEGIEFVKLQVFNRWGEKIFESSNQLDGWDGTYQGKEQNPGVYTYYAFIKYLDGKEVERKGSITLLR